MKPKIVYIVSKGLEILKVFDNPGKAKAFSKLTDLESRLATSKVYLINGSVTMGYMKSRIEKKEVL